MIIRSEFYTILKNINNNKTLNHYVLKQFEGYEFKNYIVPCKLTSEYWHFVSINSLYNEKEKVAYIPDQRGIRLLTAVSGQIDKIETIRDYSDLVLDLVKIQYLGDFKRC